jgi:hypothetical protein
MESDRGTSTGWSANKPVDMTIKTLSKSEANNAVVTGRWWFLNEWRKATTGFGEM